MKRTVTIVLLFGLLITQTELYQLLKLPVIFQHYQEHQMRDASISVFDFLVMHYTGDDKADADHDRDMQLPFKTSDYNVVSGISFAIKTEHTPIAVAPVFLIPTLRTFSCDNYNSLHASDIWQPPKQA